MVVTALYLTANSLKAEKEAYILVGFVKVG